MNKRGSCCKKQFLSWKAAEMSSKPRLNKGSCAWGKDTLRLKRDANLESTAQPPKALVILPDLNPLLLLLAILSPSGFLHSLLQAQLQSNTRIYSYLSLALYFSTLPECFKSQST